LDAEGHIIYIIHRVEDVTEFVRLEQRGSEQKAELARANERLRQANVELERLYQETKALLVAYERSERISARFQEAALPEALPAVPGFAFDACYRPGPSDVALGGDWYDALRLADGRIVLSIGDVVGSGLQAAIIMAALRQVIRGVAYINPDPVVMLDAARKALRAEHPDTYVSAFVGVIDPVAMLLNYASAGHPRPLLRRPDGSIEELAYDGVLLGVPAPAGRASARVGLSAGSLLFLYTDGLVEANDDLAACEAKLRRAISDRNVLLKKGVARDIYDIVLAEGARDDVAILTVKVFPSPFRTHGDKRVDRVSRWMFDVSDARAAQNARAEFALELRAHGANDEDVYGAEIVFGELVGNVSRHAKGSVEILVDWSGPLPVLHVRDQGPGFSHIPRLPQDILAEGGRGLYIVAALTDDFNVTRIVGQGSHARAVIAVHRRPLSLPTGDSTSVADGEALSSAL
jgi:serine phosphatase RsbU (regulator of sigma subunit)/anti-sigma regulatory factor (Ser/Thr protein kinase)